MQPKYKTYKKSEYCFKSNPPVPVVQCTRHEHQLSPFEIFPVATAVLAIGLVISIFILIHINW